MVTKAQAIEALNRVQNGTSDGWQSFDVVRRFIEQPQPVLEKINEYPDYVPPEDGNAGDYYVEGWNDCVDEMLAAAPKPEEDVPNIKSRGYRAEIESAKRSIAKWPTWMKRAKPEPGGGE